MPSDVLSKNFFNNFVQIYDKSSQLGDKKKSQEVSHSKIYINTDKIKEIIKNFKQLILIPRTVPWNEGEEDHAIARKRRIVKNSSGRSRKLAGPKGIGHDGNQVF